MFLFISALLEHSRRVGGVGKGLMSDSFFFFLFSFCFLIGVRDCICGGLDWLLGGQGQSSWRKHYVDL